MRVVNNITELIGNTPMIKLNNIVDESSAEIYIKLESFNPGSSVKDRIAFNMIKKAEKEGVLKKDSVIIEPTSGNTGIGLAMIGASLGYKVILVMPNTMSIERRNLLKAYGAKLLLTPGNKGMKGAIDKVNEFLKSNDNYFSPQQFDNINNSEVHRIITGKEIIKQMNGKIDALVAGIGTGGTITGISQVLKSHDKDIKVIGVEPENSAVISGKEPGLHKIQGIGAGFLPTVFKKEYIDDVKKIKDQEAIDTMKRLAREEGILLGISSGAAINVAIKLAKKLGKGKNIVAIAPDTGERYLSTGLFK